MSTPIRANRAEGFSLVEVVLALGVAAFSLVAILAVFPIGFTANRASISDTRAVQIANTITATIDAQCSTFANIDCFGTTLDLTSFNTTTAPQNLYVSYATPAVPAISSTKTSDSIYTVELRFDNDPAVTSTSSKFGPGKLNRIQLRISGQSAAEGFVEFFYLARNRS